MPRRKRFHFVGKAQRKIVVFVKSTPEYLDNFKSKCKVIRRQTIILIRRKPLTSFFISLGILLLVIILSNIIFSPKEAKKTAELPPKEVQTYKVGSVPKLTFQGQIEKSGVVKIFAQASAIVNKINVKEGQSVSKGTKLINLASNYSGDNAAGVQAAIAQKQYDTVSQTYDIQKDIIAKQRDMAGKVRDNADKLRDISSKSLDDTRNLVDLNNQILTTLDQNLSNLQTNNVNNVNDAAILQVQQLKSQFMSAQNQIKSGLRNLEYTSDASGTAQQMADVQKDITLKQLDLQEKSLELSRDVAKLQLSLAYISTSMYYPVAPFAGKIDRIYVRTAQHVDSGTVLFAISGNKQTVSAVVKVPEQIAKKVSKQEKSFLTINGQKLELMPSYVSSDATDGTLYSVVYDIPDEYIAKATDGSFVAVEIPVGIPDTGSAIPYVPLDAIFQTQEQAIIYVADGDKVKAKIVKLGNVTGRYVEVTEGLSDGDQIILNRNVLEGDRIKVI